MRILLIYDVVVLSNVEVRNEIVVIFIIVFLIRPPLAHIVQGNALAKFEIINNLFLSCRYFLLNSLDIGSYKHEHYPITDL